MVEHYSALDRVMDLLRAGEPLPVALIAEASGSPVHQHWLTNMAINAGYSGYDMLADAMVKPHGP